MHGRPGGQGGRFCDSICYFLWIAKIDQILQNPPSTNLGRQCHILAHSLELLW